MKKRSRRKAYLVSVETRRETPRIYAVAKPTAEEALTAVAELAAEGARVFLIGGLSRDTVRQLKLEPDELRLV